MFMCTHPTSCSGPHSLSLLLSHLLILPWASHAQMTFVTLQLKPGNLSLTSPTTWQTEANIYCLLPDYLTHFSNTTEASLHGWAAFHQLVYSSDVNIIVVETLQLASDTLGKESLLVHPPPPNYNGSQCREGGEAARISAWTDDATYRVHFTVPFYCCNHYCLQRDRVSKSENRRSPLTAPASSLQNANPGMFKTCLKLSRAYYYLEWRLTFLMGSTKLAF